MVKRVTQSYYTFFDETLQSTTYMVGIVACMIFVVGMLWPKWNVQAEYLQANTMHQKIVPLQQMITIHGEQYEVVLQKIK